VNLESRVAGVLLWYGFCAWLYKKSSSSLARASVPSSNLSALRFFLRLRHIGNCSHNLFAGKLQRPPLVLGTFDLSLPKTLCTLKHLNLRRLRR